MMQAMYYGVYAFIAVAVFIACWLVLCVALRLVVRFIGGVDDDDEEGEDE